MRSRYSFHSGVIMATQLFRGITYTIQEAAGDGVQFFGSDQPDWFQAKGGNNQIYGGNGNNVLIVGEQIKSIDTNRYGTTNIDTTPIATVGNNTIFVGSGDDFIISGIGDDTVFLGGGNNRILDNGGSNTIYGGQPGLSGIGEQFTVDSRRQ
jgi:Ca2+-binding RTX toxin-like protein